MGHLEGNFTPVLYMGRKVPKGLKDKLFVWSLFRFLLQWRVCGQTRSWIQYGFRKTWLHELMYCKKCKTVSVL